MSHASESYDALKGVANKPPHPFWGVLLLSVILGWVTFSMQLQATTFDSTEGKAIAMMAAPLLAGWGWWFYRWKQS